MDDLKNIKFITSDGNEYAFVHSIIIEDENYGLITDLNNEINCIFVKFSLKNEKKFLKKYKM